MQLYLQLTACMRAYSKSGKTVTVFKKIFVVVCCIFTFTIDAYLRIKVKRLWKVNMFRPFLKRKDRRSDPVLWQKPPYYHKMKVRGEHKDATKNFDNTAIADRLRTVSWNNYCHQIGWTGFGDLNLSTNYRSWIIKRTGHIFKKNVNNPLYRDRWPTADPSRKVIKMHHAKSLVKKTIFQDYIVTSAREGYATHRTLSPLGRFGQVPSYSPYRIVRVQRSRKD